MRVGRSGAVFEPASGAFDVTVAPGEDVQAAVDRCPPGGCVLLLPGTHAGPLDLPEDREVHVFGRGRATLLAKEAAPQLLSSLARRATVDGLLVRHPGHGRVRFPSPLESAVIVSWGRLRLQGCDISGAPRTLIRIEGGDPVIEGCRCEAASLFRLFCVRKGP